MLGLISPFPKLPLCWHSLLHLPQSVWFQLFMCFSIFPTTLEGEGSEKTITHWRAGNVLFSSVFIPQYQGFVRSKSSICLLNWILPPLTGNLYRKILDWVYSKTAFTTWLDKHDKLILIGLLHFFSSLLSMHCGLLSRHRPRLQSHTARRTSLTHRDGMIWEQALWRTVPPTG